MEPTDKFEDWEDHLYNYYHFLDTNKDGEVSNHEYEKLFNPPDISDE
jgi:hypothetical protein